MTRLRTYSVNKKNAHDVGIWLSRSHFFGLIYLSLFGYIYTWIYIHIYIIFDIFIFYNYSRIVFSHYIESHVPPQVNIPKSNNNECSPLVSNVSLLARDVT